MNLSMFFPQIENDWSMLLWYIMTLNHNPPLVYFLKINVERGAGISNHQGSADTCNVWHHCPCERTRGSRTCRSLGSCTTLWFPGTHLHLNSYYDERKAPYI